MKKQTKKLLMLLTACSMSAVAVFASGCGITQKLKQQRCEHLWDEGEVTVEATCTEKGEKTFTCTECEDTKTEELAALGHVEEVIPEVPATCTENGTTESKYCKTCEEVFVAPEVIPATGHKYVDGACECGLLKKYTVTFKNVNGDVLCSREIDHGTTPTCEVPIYTDENYVYTFAGWDKEVVPAVENATYTATFTKTRNNVIVNADGSYTVPAGYAAKAGTTFATLGGEGSVFEFTVNTTKATGWKSFVLAFVTVPEGQAAPVELNTGADSTNTLYSYTRINFALCDGQVFCGYNKNATYGGALSSGTALMEKYAAVNEGDPIAIDFKVVYAPGLFECWVDGELYFAYGSETEALKVVGEDSPVAEVINNHAGATAFGFGAYTTPCPVDVTVSNITVSEYHLHAWELVEETAATCTEVGSATYACLCGETNTEEVAALGHAYEKVVVAATCTEAGSTTYTCTTCGDVNTETVEALGHTYDGGVITDSASCMEEGEMTYTCVGCGATKTEIIPKTDHYEDPNGAPGMCGYCGLSDYEW